jgi:hypothetical protein
MAAGETVDVCRRPPKQLAPRKRSKREEDFTLRDKLAIALLHIPGLIKDEDMRKSGTTDEIINAVQFDHRTPVALGGKRVPQNGQPLANHTGEHKAKSREDNRKAKRATRVGRTNDEFWARVAAKRAGETPQAPTQTRKGNRPMPGSRASNWKRKLDGTMERR